METLSVVPCVNTVYDDVFTIGVLEMLTEHYCTFYHKWDTFIHKKGPLWNSLAGRQNHNSEKVCWKGATTTAHRILLTNTDTSNT